MALYASIPIPRNADFFNGVTHGLQLVRSLHREFPRLSYDVTIKVEHLLQHAADLPVLRDTGCAFVTSAVESLDDRALALLDKGHTRDDFFRVVELFRCTGLGLAPTFVAFTPWITLEGYAEFLETISDLDLIENLSSVQLAIRLLIPAGSRLLEVSEVQKIIGPFDQAALSYRWDHPNPRVDALQREIERRVQTLTAGGHGRHSVFQNVRHLTAEFTGAAEVSRLPLAPPTPSRATVPYLTEPWYC